jgi:hypothetical protein
MASPPLILDIFDVFHSDFYGRFASLSGHVAFRHSSDFPSNCRAEYLVRNSEIDPGGCSA